MKTTYVLIDYENVQPSDLSVLHEGNVNVVVFVGANQAKVRFEIAATLHAMGNRAEYVKANATGSNALDFHIAFYLGKLSLEQPGAHFHIVSKDTGFDPLIAHLKSKNISASRSADIVRAGTAKAGVAKAAAPKAATPKTRVAKSHSEEIDAILHNLNRRGSAKPRTLKTLASTISAMFKKTLPDERIAALIDELIGKGVVKLDGKRVTYALPE